MPPGLQVVAHRHRWRLLTELARSDRRVGELTALLGEPQNLVSYHLRELRDAGLVSSRRSSFDGRDAYYRVNLGPCSEVFSGAAASLDPGLRLATSEPAPSDLPERVSVLFLCTGNSARSQMAEALMDQLSGGAIEARSAGSRPRPLDPKAVRVMAERRVDIAGKRPKHLDEFEGVAFDYVITLCDKVREVCPQFAGPAEPAHWSIPDPSETGDTDEASFREFERVADDLEVRIRHLIAHIAALKGATNHAR